MINLCVQNMGKILNTGRNSAFLTKLIPIEKIGLQPSISSYKEYPVALTEDLNID